MAPQRDSPKFEIGRLLVTPNALEALDPEDIRRALVRHAAGDWGDLDAEDSSANQFALDEGLRLLSVYRGRSDTKFYVITEADRSATTVLLPEDY
jgi:hypothetical protein